MKSNWLLACSIITALAFFGCGSDTIKGDGGSADGGNTDGGNTDGGNTDGGNTDGGNTDGGNTDGGNTDGGNTDGDDNKPKCDASDADGDTISDDFEGRAESVDTDADTTPDYLDEDSDGDTIPDSIEAFTNNCSGTEPADADADDIPNFRSPDSDSNGILDSLEAGSDPLHPVDTDGDTLPDFVSTDNDGDTIDDRTEINGQIILQEDGTNNTFGGDCNSDGVRDTQGSAQSPIDCNANAIPDYLDKDSDGDTIPDSVEGNFSLNGIFARYSQDSDGDGLLDKDEAGDDVHNLRDTDGDSIPDMFDVDSDADGLSDKYEHEHGLDPYNSDSDGDGASDLIEFGAGSDALNPSDNPQSRGNFVFVVPYKGETTPKKQTLSFETGIQTVDIYFSIDQSGSMNGEIKTLQNKLPDMLQQLQCKDLGRACTMNSECSDLNSGKSICSENNRCIVSPKVGPDGKGCFADMYTGVGWWGDINKFRNGSSLSGDVSQTVAALGNVPDLGYHENSIQPSICAMWGSQYCSSSNLNCYSGSDRTGCVGFRNGAVKLYVQAGDEANSGSGNFKTSDSSNWGVKLKDAKVRYVGLWGSSSALNDGISQMACFAGSCATGNCAANCQSPTLTERNAMYLVQIQDSDIVTQTMDILRKLAMEKLLQITSAAADIDAGAAQLVAALNVNTSGDTINNRVCTNLPNISGAPMQQIDSVTPGVSICYDVIPVESQSIFPAKSEPQVLKARIQVLGDGSVLNSGIAYFLVPPVFEQNTIN